MENVRVQNCCGALKLEDGHTASSSSGSSPSSVCGEQDVVVVRRCALRLHSLSRVCVSTALRVCVLCDNFITDIEPLRQCVNLLKLDLKGNQITQLPEASFWKNLKDLQLLFLHDNGICVMSAVTGLSVSPSLSALTLYGTPLSRRRNYRHGVINSIFSLKALDHHVISDEEIIENWQLPLRFKALTPNLCVNLYPSPNTDSDEVKALRGIISEINRVQAAFSPTLIIQKWIRGHLTRRCLGLCSAPVLLKTQERDVNPMGSVWEAISRRSCIMSAPHVLLQQDSNFRSFHNRTLSDPTPPCNTPQPSNHGHKLKISFMDERRDEAMDLNTFCLYGFKAFTYLSKPSADMLISRKNDGQEIRDGVIHFHTQKSNPPNTPWPRPPNITPVRRLIGRCHDCLSLATFWAVERAHKERQNEEKLKERAKQVMEVQNHRDEAQGHREGFMEARRTGALLRQKQERDKLEEILKLQRIKQEQEVQLVNQKHLRFLAEKQRNMVEQETVKRFSQQHIALSKSLSKLYTDRRLRETQTERRRRITISTQHTGSQTVQGYLENRKQNKPAVSWISINPPLFQEQPLSHKVKSGGTQLIRGGLDRPANHNENKIN